jgi:myo-inositol-1(or 4)-monophosphatase
MKGRKESYCSFKEKAMDEIKKILIKNDYFTSANTMDFSVKEDGSRVTRSDIEISEKLENLCSEHFPDFAFLSEEKLEKNIEVPQIIIDPIDGTNEFIQKVPECVMSIAWLQTEELADPVNRGWIWNFSNGLEKDSKTAMASSIGVSKRSDGQLLEGFVSRTEWNNRLYDKVKNDKIHLRPVGSIAYKLLQLSWGQCDFVISMRPKNIWDIAAGSVLLSHLGYCFYSNGKRVTHLNQLLYQAPLLWCRPGDKQSLFSSFKFKK